MFALQTVLYGLHGGTGIACGASVCWCEVGYSTVLIPAPAIPYPFAHTRGQWGRAKEKVGSMRHVHTLVALHMPANHADFILFAKHVVQAMTDNPHFPSPTPALKRRREIDLWSTQA